jgi:O-antigen/teichoic acid export membrane protein
VRDERGDDPAYLNTAWTMQVVRGVLVWLISCLLAYPASIFYQAPELALLVPAIGFTAVIQGLHSPVILKFKRYLRVRPLIFLELATQFITVLITVFFAWKYGSVWSIALGGVVGSLIGCVLSYMIDRRELPTLAFESRAVGNIFAFGKWIFVSTALTFLIQQGDILVLGVFLSKDQLGMFSIAAIWSRIFLHLVLKLNERVMLPLYSEAYRDNRITVIDTIRKTRIHLLFATLPFICLMVVFGQLLIEFLYDPRYSSAGWMLQLLSIGTVGSVITATSGTALLSFGDSYRFMAFQVSRAVLLIICMAVGGYWFDVVGIIVGVAASKILSYPFLALALHKHGVWLPKIDAIALSISTVFSLAGIWVFGGIQIQ